MEATSFAAKRKKARNAMSMILPANILSSSSPNLNPYTPNPAPPPIPVSLSQTSNTAAFKRRDGAKEIRDFFLNILNDIFRAVGLQENTIKEIVLHFEHGLQSAEERDFAWLRKKPRSILETMSKKVDSFLDRQKEQEKYVTVQSLCRKWLVRKKLNFQNNSFEKLLKRNRSYFQLVKSEREYYKKLLLMKNIQKELRKTHEKNKQEISALFSNVESLCILEGELLVHLERLDTKWPLISGVSRAFLSIGEALKLYGEYADNFQFALQTQKELHEKKPKTWSSFLETAHSLGLDPSEDFSVLLNEPVGRIKVYEAFFEDQLTDFGSDPSMEREQVDVIAAHGLVQQWSDLFRKRLELSHVRASVQRIQNQLQPSGSMNLMVAGRAIFREGHVYSTKKGQKYHLVLFTDLLLITKPKGQERLKLKGYCDLSQIQVSCVTPNEVRAATKDNSIFEVRTTTASFTFADSSGTWAHDITELSRKKRNKVFGVALREVLEAEGKRGSGVPIVVETLVAWLVSHDALRAEGLLRISGSSSRTAALKNHLDRKIPPDAISTFIPDSLVESPHDVAAILKHYFKELPEPLLSFSLYDDLLAIMKSSTATPEDRLRTLKEMVSRRLPDDHVKLLRYLTDFLAQVAALSSVNFMNSHNLAIVFTPNLIRPKEATLESAMNAPYLLGSIEMMIDYRDHLFYGGPFPKIESASGESDDAQSSSPRKMMMSTKPKPKQRLVSIITTTAAEDEDTTAEKSEKTRERVVTFNGTDSAAIQVQPRQTRSNTGNSVPPPLRSALKLPSSENLRALQHNNEPLLTRTSDLSNEKAPQSSSSGSGSGSGSSHPLVMIQPHSLGPALPSTSSDPDLEPSTCPPKQDSNDQQNVLPRMVEASCTNVNTKPNPGHSPSPHTNANSNTTGTPLNMKYAPIDSVVEKFPPGETERSSVKYVTTIDPIVEKYPPGPPTPSSSSTPVTSKYATIDSVVEKWAASSSSSPNTTSVMTPSIATPSLSRSQNHASSPSIQTIVQRFPPGSHPSSPHPQS